jgi:hypothetical protein
VIPVVFTFVDDAEQWVSKHTKRHHHHAADTPALARPAVADEGK